ncbi:MAG: YybS family protein [Rhodospirillaceae bacterium]|nr:YybS family protein [Rhodospirillaceae bacterium]
MTRPSTLAVGAGALGGALLAAFFKGSILGMLFGAMLSPLPLAMAALGLGPMFLPVAVVSGAVTVTVLTGSVLMAAIYLVIDAAPIAVIARFARASEGGERPSGEALGKAIAVMAVGAVLLVIAGLLGMAQDAGDGTIEALLRSRLDEMLAAAPIGSGGAATSGGVDLAAARAEIVRRIAGILPGAAAWNWSLRALISAVLGQLMLKRMGIALIETPLYKRFAAPLWPLLLFGGAALAAVTIEGDAGFIAGNAAVALCLVPVLQGLAVVHTIAGRVSYPRVALAVFYVSALRFPAVALIVLVTVGMVEHFFALRSRIEAPQPGGQ